MNYNLNIPEHYVTNNEIKKNHKIIPSKLINILSIICPLRQIVELKRNMHWHKHVLLMGKTITNNIPENAADIISPNLQESMRSNNQRAAIINHQKHK